MIDAATNVVKPAAGPDTPREAPLMSDTTNPPMIPESNPAYNGAPDASAMPKQSGKATKKTESPAGRSCLIQSSR